MAVERDSAFTIDLSSVVQTRLTNFQNTVTNIRAKQDADFATQVLNQGLSYDQQLAYYQSRLKNEKDKDYPDGNYISTLGNTIAGLEKLQRFEKFRTDYVNNYTAYKNGKFSVDDLIKNTESFLATETDTTARNSLNDMLQSLKLQKIQDEKDLITNRITLAENDKSIDTLNGLMSEVQNKKVEANASGNDSLASSYDVMIQGLKSQISKIQIEDKINDADFNAFKNNSSAIDKLNSLDSLIASADKTTSVNVGGVTYNSESDYFSHQRDLYISGAGKDTFADFFKDLKNDTNSQLAKISATNTFGYIPTSTIESINSTFKNLQSKQEFQIYADKLELNRLDLVTSAIDVTAKAIINEAQANIDYDQAETSLKSLGSQFKVDTSNYIFDLYTKKLNVGSDINKMNAAAEALAALKGTTPEEEFKKLSEFTVAGESGKTIAEQEKKTTDTTTTPTTPAPIGGEYTVKSGDTLSGIYGKDWQKLSGYTGDPTKLQIGTKLPMPPSQTQQPVQQPIQQPIQQLTQQPTTPKPVTYTGVSIVDYLASIGQASDYTSRSKLAAEKGIAGYAGTAAQNTQLLKLLRGS